MRMITTLIQVLMVASAVWILYALYISRQTVANSARVCPSCKLELKKFDLVHCGKCLQDKQNPASGPADFFKGGK